MLTVIALSTVSVLIGFSINSCGTPKSSVPAQHFVGRACEKGEEHKATHSRSLLGESFQDLKLDIFSLFRTSSEGRRRTNHERVWSLTLLHCRHEVGEGGANTSVGIGGYDEGVAFAVKDSFGSRACGVYDSYDFETGTELYAMEMRGVQQDVWLKKEVDDTARREEGRRVKIDKNPQSGRGSGKDRPCARV